MFLLSFCYSTHYIAIFDGGLSLLYAGFQFAEAVWNGKFEVTAILGVDVVAPAENVALRCATLIMHVFMERSTGQQTHGEAVITEERAL